MKIHITLLLLLAASNSFSQMQPVDKVYVIEGVVADRESLKSIPSAILYNDSLGIMTTTNEKGYFKVVVPLELILKKQRIPIEISKPGYKLNRSGFPYNPGTDTARMYTEERIIWNWDIKYFLMAKNESTLNSTCGAHIRIDGNPENTALVLEAYNQTAASEVISRKLDQLKEGNEKVFFQVDGTAAFVTDDYNVYSDQENPLVFINNKKIKASKLNTRLKRSQARIDWPKSDAYTKQYKKDVIVFTVAD